MIAALLVTVAAGLGPVASDESRGWAVLESTPLGAPLYTVELRGGAPHLRQVGVLPAAPALAAAWDQRLWMVMEPAGHSEQIWPVRTLVLDAAGLAGQAEARAPLTSFATPLGLAATRDGVFAITRDTAGRAELMRLGKTAWEAVEAPRGSGIDSGALLTLGGDLALLSGGRLQRRGGGGEWLTTTIWGPEPGERVLAMGSQVVALKQAGAGLRMRILLRDGTVERTLEGGDEPALAVMAVGDRLVRLRREEGGGARFAARVTTLEGIEVFSGPVSLDGMVDDGAVRTLMLVLSVIGVTTLIFVLRGDAPGPGTPPLPEGAALCPAGQRMFAGSIDALVGAAVCIGLESAGLMPLTPVDGAAGLAVMAAGALIGAASEAATGRTLGKALVGARVIGPGGRRVGPARAVARNVVRFFCPPLGLAWMLGTAEKPRELFGTLVIVRRGEG
ncbi:MAG: RDD family protein [Planctomycetota bacterium]|nr:RDD family protein [Planctomycetota bacterium]